MAKVKKAQTGADVPKGYVRGEMTGKLIKKSVQDKWESGMADALDKQAGTGKYAKKPATKKAAPKAKDGKWIQKAINPKHKGYCTPMTKATCTPKRKALAMTLKKMAKARKGK
jgi:hypothetical protein